PEAPRGVAAAIGRSIAAAVGRAAVRAVAVAAAAPLIEPPVAIASATAATPAPAPLAHAGERPIRPEHGRSVVRLRRLEERDRLAPRCSAGRRRAGRTGEPPAVRPPTTPPATR